MVIGIMGLIRESAEMNRYFLAGDRMTEKPPAGPMAALLSIVWPRAVSCSGASVLIAIERGLECISDAVIHLRDRRDTGEVSTRTTTAVSAFWLTPRIFAFWRLHPFITGGSDALSR